MSQPQPPAPAPPPYYIPSAGAPPGAMPAGQRGSPLATIGITCIVLAVAELGLCLFKLGSSVLGVYMYDLQKSLVSSAGGSSSGTGIPPHMFDTLREFAVKAAIWESVRVLPYGVAAGFLLAIGFGLRQGKRRSLQSARVWVWWALGVVALSVLIQAFAIIPLSREMQQTMIDQMSAGVPRGLGRDIQDQMGMFAAISGVLQLVVGAVLMAIWPIVLRIWADRLNEPPEQPAAAGST